MKTTRSKHKIVLTSIIIVGAFFIASLCIVAMILRQSHTNKGSSLGSASVSEQASGPDKTSDEKNAVSAALIIDASDIYKSRTGQYPSADKVEFVKQINSLSGITLDTTIAANITNDPSLPHYSQPSAIRLHQCESSNNGEVTGIEAYYYKSNNIGIESTGDGCQGNQETSHAADTCISFARIAKLDEGGICNARAALGN